ncbi:hypothetical protein [Pseudomaricurvus sp. HS19]|uniref:hypothetical protein n=1 Tax=Pseudomaricurvus sp. HS19 TaxID=2692626 RepID=UPI00136929A7|nr:hypothetical protein [Pseudomaricurvus sp. HS19]MYM62978.1 hypothetical protein [Pseudomaricurvus sp. HS19]
MIAALRKVLNTILILGLLVTNVLTLTSSAVHDALYGLLNRLPISEFLKSSPTSKNKALKSQVAKQKRIIAKTRKVSNNISKRAVRAVSANVASIPAEAIPFVGVAFIVGVTAMDVKFACDTMTDLDELSSMMDGEDLAGDRAKVCGTVVPTADEIVEKLKAGSSSAYEALGGTLYEIFDN